MSSRELHLPLRIAQAQAHVACRFCSSGSHQCSWQGHLQVSLCITSCVYTTAKLPPIRHSQVMWLVVEGLLASWISKRFGRRVTMIMGGFAFMLGSILQATANEIVMLVWGRIILGFAIGLANQVRNCGRTHGLNPLLPDENFTPSPFETQNWDIGAWFTVTSSGSLCLCRLCRCTCQR